MKAPRGDIFPIAKLRLRAALASGRPIMGGADDDDGGEGENDDPPESDSAPPTPSDKETEAAKAEAERYREEAAKAKARASEMAKQIEAIKKNAGKESKEAIAALEAQLADQKAEIEARDKREADRVKARFDALPKAAQEKLAAVKDEIPVGALDKLIDAELKSAGPDPKPTPKAPRGGAPRRDASEDSEGYEHSDQLKGLLRQIGHSRAAESLEGMEFVQRNDGDNNIWRMTMDQFIGDSHDRRDARFEGRLPRGVNVYRLGAGGGIAAANSGDTPRTRDTKPGKRK